MALAQVAQAIATWFALGVALDKLGFKWTLVLGTSSWVLMYIVYAASAPRPVIFVSQVLHGIAYVMFMIVTQVYCGAIAPAGTAASMQALIFAATVGLGLFLGTQLAGFAMDWHKTEGKFQWPKIWTYPLVITLAGTLIFATVFQGKVPEKPAQAPAAPASSAATVSPLQALIVGKWRSADKSFTQVWDFDDKGKLTVTGNVSGTVAEKGLLPKDEKVPLFEIAQNGKYAFANDKLVIDLDEAKSGGVSTPARHYDWDLPTISPKKMVFRLKDASGKPVDWEHERTE